ncbi:MAG: ATP-binding cassette domain-containing protein [Bacteroidales bacterium]|nr:ATP-binding cassette domain-containing protein [Bacteroidales bacterium]
MSESILKALMHLFAVVAALSDQIISESGRSIVKSYLSQHLKKDVAEDYLTLFNDFYDFYQRDQNFQIKGVLPSTSITNSETLIRICNQIKVELHRNERIVVLLRLIEFTFIDKVISDTEKEFVHLVADTFSIQEKELQNAFVFITGEDYDKIDPEYALFISREETSEIDELEGDWIERNRPEQTSTDKKIIRNDLDGMILVLHFSSINIFVFKYTGKQKILHDGQPIIPEKFYILSSGAILRSPEIGSIYYSDIASQFLKPESDVKIILNAENLEFRFKNSINGIQSFNFCEDSGQLIGIMGGSGVGKSTLLSLLSGQLAPDHGKITLNDYDLLDDRFKLKGIIGFVPQDDLLFEELTVFQNLYYNAKLCFGAYTDQAVLQEVNRILQDLEINDIKDLKVGNPLDKYISGGQRKRLNIGLELMRQPSVLFVDEPTSGLSSTDSENVIRLLKEQSIKGKLVIVNIHQPSSEVFKLFDKLWVLDKGGYPIYSGNPVDSIMYFKRISSYADTSEVECPSCGNINPDQILQIIEAKKVDEQGHYTSERKVTPEEWNQHYKQDIEPGIERIPTKNILPRSMFSIPGIDVQFKIFLFRNLISKITNRQYVLINLVEAPLLAFILSYFIKYFDGVTFAFSANKNLPTYLFMSVIVCLFMGLVVSAEEIIKDRKILKRESFLNLSRSSYLNSKILYLFLLSALQTFLFVIVGNTILEIKGMTAVYWLILFSTACFGNLVGLNISAGLNSVISIYILIPLILIPQLLLSGVPVAFDDLHKSLTSRKYVPLIGDIMTSRWAYEALAVEQFKNNRFEKNFYELDRRISESSFKTTFLVPRLINVLEECERNMDNPAYEPNLERNISLLKNEITLLGEQPDIFPFEYLENLDPELFDEEIVEETLDYLNYVRFSFQNMVRESQQQRNSLYSALTDSMGEETLIELRKNYHNDKLSDLVTNRMEVNQILTINNRLIQKRDPVFHIAESNIGRAHFYAPFKKFNNQLYDTKWYNLIFIWGFIFILYVTLLLDLLRKFLRYFEIARLRRQ